MGGMSDTQQGPDWWQASDGKWYPPQPPTAAPPPPGYAPYPMPTAAPPKKSNKGCLIAVLVVFGLFAVLVLGSILAITFLGREATSRLEDLESTIENPAVDPSNPDANEEDQNVELGESVELSGYTTTVESAQFVDTLSEVETEGYLIADVIVFNRDDEPQPYNVLDWRLQTPNGQVLDPTFTSSDDSLSAGELIKGGNVRGKVIFEVGAATGDFFLIYKPDPFDAARGLWKVTLE